jgi:hypothetical protein
MSGQKFTQGRISQVGHPLLRGDEISVTFCSQKVFKKGRFRADIQ